MKRIFICALGIACLSFLRVQAKDFALPTQYRQILETVPAPELSAKAAALVKDANSRDRATTTAAVTKAALTISPAAAPSVVNAIARAVPDMAATAAGTAAMEQPRHAAAIAKAAVSAAPSKVGKIVFAICRVVPTEYRSVAIIVSETVPGSAKKVLKAIALAIPELNTVVKQALAGDSGDSLSIAAVLDGATVSNNNILPAEGLLPLGISVGLPIIPVSDTVRTITPDTSGEVPTGGRDYVTP